MEIIHSDLETSNVAFASRSEISFAADPFSENILKEIIFPRMLLNELRIDRVEKSLPFGENLFLCPLELFPQVCVLRLEVEGVGYPLAIVYKYLDDINFCGGCFPIFSRVGSGKLISTLEDAFLRFILQPPENLSRLVSPKGTRVNFHLVNGYGVDQIIRFERAQKIFSELPVFPTVYTIQSPYLPPLMECAADRVRAGEKILVMGSGAGVEATYLAHCFRAQIDAVDINPLAVVNTRASALKTKTYPFIRAWVSDGFSAIRDRYDKIIFNAPFPVKRGDRSDANLDDRDGKLLHHLLSNLPQHLNSRGEMLLMTTPDLASHLPDALTSEALHHFDSYGKKFSIQSCRAMMEN